MEHAVDQREADVVEVRVRRARRRWLVLLVVVLVGAPALGWGLAAVGFDPAPTTEPSAGREDASLVVAALAVLAVVVGLVMMVRGRSFRGQHRRDLWALTVRERRRGVRAVRRGCSVPAQDLGATTSMARSMARQRRALVLYVGIALNAVSQALGSTNPWWIVFMTLTAVLVAVGVVSSVRDARRADRWLDAHPQPAPAGG